MQQVVPCFDRHFFKQIAHVVSGFSGAACANQMRRNDFVPRAHRVDTHKFMEVNNWFKQRGPRNCRGDLQLARASFLER